MGGVQDRVKEFLRSWRDLVNVGTAVCSRCGVELTDGNFAVFDGKLYCLACHEEVSDGTK